MSGSKRAPRRTKSKSPPRGSSEGVFGGVAGSSLFGRELDVARLEAWAGVAAAGPLLITGPGGIGKTALLRAFMATHPEGRTIDCTYCSSVEEVGVAIASALDVEAASAREPRRLVRRAKELEVSVLAFDNVEGLASHAAELEPFFRLVPHTLATSRITLGLPGELPLVLAPLASGTANAAATELLRWRSGLASSERALAPEEEALLAQISALTDGIPLALELAATQVVTFGLSWTAEQLGKGLLASGSSDEGGQREGDRGRTLLATFWWSWRCLGDRERAAVARLSLFSGPFSLVEAGQLLEKDDAEVAAIVSTLARHNWVAVGTTPRLVVARPGADPRFRMLVPLREFARQRLAESKEDPSARERYDETVLASVEPAAAHLRAEQAKPAMDQIGRFYPDLLDIMRSSRGGAARPLRAARAMIVAGHWALETGAISSFGEAADGAATEAAIAAAPRRERFRALVTHAKVDAKRGRLREARSRAELATQLVENDEESAACLHIVALAQSHGGDLEAAYQTLMDARELCQDPALACRIALSLAGTTRWMGLDAEARSAATEGIGAARAVGDASTESRLLAMLAAVSYDAGELAKAELAAREAVQIVDAQSSGGMYARAVLADILVAKQEWDEADASLVHILNGADTSVMVQQAAVFTRAHIRVKRGLLDEARAMLESQSGEGQELSIRTVLDALSAVVYARQGLFAKAERFADAAYGKTGGMIDAAFSRTLLLGYELERLKISPRDDDARRRVEETFALISDSSERGRSWIVSNGDVRLALASLRDDLTAAGFRVPAEQDDRPELVLERGGDEARLGARSLALGHRHTLRHILLGLLAAPGGAEISVDGVFALGWPSERVPQRVRRNRVHVALATLRRDLLGPWLRRTASGYAIDPAVTVVRRE